MKREQGFSLIEFVMVMVIIAVISVVIGKILLQSGQSFTNSNRVSQVDWQGFSALSRLTDDIHSIRSSGDILTITSSQLSFTDDNGSNVQYTLSGSTLLRNSQTLATGVTSFSLSYLNNAGSVTATASLVRYISISLSITHGNITTAFSTLVGTRGLT